MPIEFVVLLNELTFPVSQVIPEVYNEEAFIDDREIYIISSEGYRYKVELVTPDEEGDDCFYVTGYNRDGIEFGGYGVNKSTFSRFMTRVLPYPYIPQTLPADFLSNLNDVDEIEISVNGVSVMFDVFREENMYVLSIATWNWLVATLGLESGSVCVFTRNRGKSLWFDAFNNDGSALTDVVFKGAASLRRFQLPLTEFEQNDDRMRHVCFWPFHMDHFGEIPMTFYKSFSKIVPQNRLTIPAHFVDFHRIHTYQKTLIVHQEYQVLMDVHMEPHAEDPSRTNHVTIRGPWRILGDGCRFPLSKVIRFRYMSDGVDLDVEEGLCIQCLSSISFWPS
ncbi:hypothetical protein Tco_0915172 [Tanacetum coccineum]